MLSIAKNYIPYDEIGKKKHTIRKEYKADHLPNVYDAALSLGLCKTYFTSKTKNTRLMKLLGAGNVKVGYEKYMQLTDQLTKALNNVHDILDNRVWGFKVFDHFSGHTERYTQRLKYEIDNRGITNYKKIHTVHQILKSFKALEQIKNTALLYIPIEKRIPLTEKFIKKHYWTASLTTEQIADELCVPESWVEQEITRLGMKKKDNGIKRKGRKGWKPPEGYGEARRNQPHARAVVQICPKTFLVLRSFDSTGAVERDGWGRENVRKSIKSAGLHDGFLWAYKGKEAEVITRAKAKGTLERKLELLEKGKIRKEDLQRLYIEQKLSKEEVAEILGFSPATIVSSASRFGLTKRTNISDELLKHHYIQEGRSAKEIADMYGYKACSISTYLSKRGITRKRTG